MLIFTNVVFEALQREVAKYFVKKRSKPKQKTDEQLLQISESVPTPSKIFRDYEPTNIHAAYEGNIWRWRRMYDWFNQLTLDDRQGAYSKNIIKQLAE